ncbi:hypothetical protein LEP1GSC103_1332 [Leptospira borgpetersenii serovar Javanica str. UI 09931]|uniref:Uncharacterized protein n=5 Tax=Leptospira borgpetersenii TaxID=174 RepID=M3GW55_LEPBO|nr:hypothetical protein LBBP_02899 [Leptospira borgpetersenii serovar Ballum]EKP15067.1 hypothetical protein LEP1GSC128_2428 [Leptospira borgpetersenii str. 200801926]EKQ90272.1 hypothetical protein LEP1GSC101_2220 [Leptospira borgpetersenii str. UI 09149]EKQ99122.1 hypothetical protein LEP1GSC121_2532 [Leptospira borgpetersenii serovar Castellonis str. 200801910]EMF99053.1 hypothetical protein LEP1GSC123_0125 [Leptospira borgpetersenii str. 200701203]EMK12125.1 hypothetical protein LEP1GSC066
MVDSEIFIQWNATSVRKSTILTRPIYVSYFFRIFKKY